MFKNDCSSNKFVYYIKNKFETFFCFKHIVAQVQWEIHCHIMTLQIDHIGKLCSKQFAPYLYVQHIMYETNKYYIPQQDGFIEHDDQTITKVAHNMLYAKSLPLCMLSTLPYIFSINLIQLVMAWDQAYCLTLLSLWLFCLHVH
jgi:hypothetical protein